MNAKRNKIVRRNVDEVGNAISGTRLRERMRESFMIRVALWQISRSGMPMIAATSVFHLYRYAGVRKNRPCAARYCLRLRSSPYSGLGSDSHELPVTVLHSESGAVVGPGEP